MTRIECPPLHNHSMIEPRPLWMPEVAEFAYTQRQKSWYGRVYKGHFFSLDTGTFLPVNGHRIEIHHILPAATLIESGIDPNSLNILAGIVGIPLKREDHLGKIHKDMDQAIKDYFKDPQAIKKAVARHHEMARQGRVYWDNRWDAVMVTAARKMIAKYLLNNPTDPYPPDVSWAKRNGRVQ